MNFVSASNNVPRDAQVIHKHVGAMLDQQAESGSCARWSLKRKTQPEGPATMYGITINNRAHYLGRTI